MEYAILIISIIGISLTTPFFSRVVDKCMDYGGIFGFIRYIIASRLRPSIIDNAKELIKKDSANSVQYMDTAYWEVYYKTRSILLKSIICIDCITIRQNFIINLSLIICLSIFFSNIYFIFLAPFLLIFSIGINNYIYGLLQ